MIKLEKMKVTIEKLIISYLLFVYFKFNYYLLMAIILFEVP